MQREESAAPAAQGKFKRKRKSSIVAERASTSAHKIKPEKEMMKKKKKKLRAKAVENIEASFVIVADMKTELQSSKSFVMEKEAMVEAFQGVVTQMRELNEQLSRMNSRDQFVADYIYNNLL